TFAIAATGLIYALPGATTDDDASAAPAVAATRESPSAAHAGHAPTDAAPDALTAPKNTMSADAPAYRPAKVHTVHLDMTEREAEIAPGKVVKIWTFGDQVPGPVIRVRVGETVKATITNSGALPHSIDF